MRLQFTGEVWHWRGPAPWHFVTVPDEEAGALHDVAHVSYGWGMIPVTVRVGRTEWATSLWPKDDGYIVPLKTAVRTRRAHRHRRHRQGHPHRRGEA